MKSIALMSQKGGSGKTTIAVHLAVAAQATGETVVIVDTDPQRSAYGWGHARHRINPRVVAGQSGRLSASIGSADLRETSLMIVDTPPHAAPDAARIAAAVDLVLIPCRPTAFDLAAVGAAVRIAAAARTPAVLVLSACPARAPEVAEAEGVLAQFNLPICPVRITERRAFARAVAQGRAVTEYDAEGKAALEIRGVWQWLGEQLAQRQEPELAAPGRRAG